MGSHGAVGKGGGGKEKGKPGIADPGASAAAVVSAVEEVGWLVPDEPNTQHFQAMSSYTRVENKTKQHSRCTETTSNISIGKE